jgi:hypothetical protein
MSQNQTDREPLNDLTLDEAERARKELKEVEAWLDKAKLKDGTSGEYLQKRERRAELRTLLGLK